jgi:hypothetical protein
MMNKIIGGYIALCLSMFYVSPTYAQTKPPPDPDSTSNPGTQCRPMEDAIKHIKDTFGEHLIFRGLSVRGHVTTVYYNATTGTWTALILYPTLQHKMCVVDSGSVGEAVDEDPANKISTDPLEGVPWYRRFFNINVDNEYFLRFFQ